MGLNANLLLYFMNFHAISLNQEKIRKPSYVHIFAFMFNCPIFSRAITNFIIQLLKINELIIQRKTALLGKCCDDVLHYSVNVPCKRRVFV